MARRNLSEALESEQRALLGGAVLAYAGQALSEGEWSRRKSVLLLGGLISLAPLLFQLVAVDGAIGVNEVARWLAWAVVFLGMIALPDDISMRLRSLRFDLDELTEQVPDAALAGQVRWIESRYRLQPQVAAAIAGAVVVTVPISTLIARDGVAGTTARVLLVMTFGALAGLALYGVWLTLASVHRVASLRPLNLLQLAPYRTRALLRLSSLLKLEALYGLILVVGYTGAALFAIGDDPRPPMWMIAAGAFCGLTAVMLVGVVSLGWLASAAEEGKSEALDRLAAAMSCEIDTDQRLTLLTEFRVVEASASGYSNLPVLAQYVAALAAVGLQFALASVAQG